jgi:hypothetical protein
VSTATETRVQTLVLGYSTQPVESATVKPWRITWDDFIAKLKKPTIGTKEGSYWTRCAMTGTHRSDDESLQGQVLVLDGDKHIVADTGDILDGAPPAELVHEALRDMDITHAIIPSHSDRPGRPRYRVVMPVQIDGADELDALVGWVLHKLISVSVHLAPVKENLPLSQPWYMPRCPDQAALDRFRVLEHDGGQDFPKAEALAWAATHSSARTPPENAKKSEPIDPFSPIGRFITKYGTASDLMQELVARGYRYGHPGGAVDGEPSYWLRAPGSTTGGYGVRVFYSQQRKCWVCYSHHGEHDPLADKHAHHIFDVIRLLRFGGDFDKAKQHAMKEAPGPKVNMGSNPEGWPELDPLPDEAATEPQAFPHHALGKLLGGAAKAIAEGVQAPDALAGGSVLASAALVAQAHADVEMPHGQRAPLSVFVVTGALSGDRKTATDAVASLPAEEYRREQARAHAAALDEYERDCAARQKGDPEVKQPVAKSLTIGKATVEGLHMMLRNQSHIGLFTGEGGELLGGHSLREDRRSAGLAWFLKAWGAETLDSLTSGKGLSILLGRRVSMHAMVQPVLLRGLLVDPLAQGQGFLARCLVAEPGTLAGTRLFKTGNPAEHPAVKAYHAALRGLLQKPAPVHRHGDGNELQPRALVMSAQAAGLWIEFYNQIETEQGLGAELQGARAFASKAAEHAARIAGIISIVNDPDAVEVSLDAMTGAIQVAAFYISEHVRLTGVGLEDRRVFLLRLLAGWLSEHGRATQKHILQSAPRPIRVLKAEGIKPLLDELAQRGYIRRSGDAWEARP